MKASNLPGKKPASSGRSSSSDVSKRDSLDGTLRAACFHGSRYRISPLGRHAFYERLTSSRRARTRDSETAEHVVSKEPEFTANPMGVVAKMKTSPRRAKHNPDVETIVKSVRSAPPVSASPTPVLLAPPLSEPTPHPLMTSPPSTWSGPGPVQLTRHERHWHADDEHVIKCQKTLFTVNVQNSQLVESSEFFANLLSDPANTVTLEGRRLVDITNYCEDVDGFALILDNLDPRGCMFDHQEGPLVRQALRRLLCASHALGFSTTFDKCVDYLNSFWSSDATAVARSHSHISMDEAIQNVECVLRCGSHKLDNIYKCAVYAIVRSRTASFQAQGDRLAKVYPGQRLVALCVLRELCIQRWAEFLDAPLPGYIPVCEHASEMPPAMTDAQTLDEARRWNCALRKIELKGWSNDPLRAMGVVRRHMLVRPQGWEECPGRQCTTVLADAWDRRFNREWADIQDLVMKHLPLE